MAIIMQTSSIIFSLILLLTASVTGNAVYAQERIRIASGCLTKGLFQPQIG